ncbi:MAG: substrate-binding domain-containing protein [Acetivibrionales bacterium]|jgi:ribose transport system substrate-binding protein
MKRFIALLLVVILAVSFAGCGAKPSKDAPGDSTNEGKSSEGDSTTELAAADVAEQGFDYYDKAVQYEDIADKLGPIPKIDKELKIGYVCKAFENEFWRMQKEGAEAAVKPLNDLGIKYTVDVRAAQGETDEQGQLAVLNDMINKKYDGILMSPISEGNLLPGVENALKSNITLTVVNDAFMPQIGVTVGAWHLQAAELAAEWVNEKIGGEGQVAIVQGLPKAPPARTRTEGFKNWFEKNNDKVEVVAIQNADWDRMKAKDVVDIWMKQYPDLKAIYANNDTMAMGALEAVKAAGKLGQCLVVGTDGTSEARQSIKAGELAATVDSFPYFMSQIGTEMLIRKIAGQDVPKVIYSPQAVIDSTNVDVDAEEIIGWKGFKAAD